MHVEPNIENFGMDGNVYMDGFDEKVSDAKQENIIVEDGVFLLVVLRENRVK